HDGFGRMRQSFYVLHQPFAHLIIITLVPLPTSLLISNSLANRRAPGNPSPKLLPVEKPSFKARPTSSMPGPSSLKVSRIPDSLPRAIVSIDTIPPLAYLSMLRANSLAAVISFV